MFRTLIVFIAVSHLCYAETKDYSVCGFSASQSLQVTQEEFDKLTKDKKVHVSKVRKDSSEGIQILQGAGEVFTSS